MKIPVSRVDIGELEKKYVNEAIETRAISGVFGSFIDRFENEFSKFCETKYAVSCSNGTTALHLAMASAGVKEGDEVLVSTLTNMATFFAVLYLGAKPVPVDIDLKTLTMDPNDLSKKISKKSKAIMVVHLFGHPTDMDPINMLANDHELLVFEDCAEAHGSIYKNQKVGSLSNAGCFSFFANKILTTGEGGMVTTNDILIANKARNLKALAFGNSNKFMHQDIGFNYRMTNLQAAIGCGQMARADELVEKRRSIAYYYSERFKILTDHINLPFEMNFAKSSFWMYHIVLQNHLIDKRLHIMNSLKDLGIETREGFIPYNLQNIFIDRGWTNPNECPNANKIAYSSFYLPTGPDISENELDYVATNFCKIIYSLI